MEANEMGPWTGHEHGQALHELQRRHHDMGGTVVVRAFELQHDMTGTIAFEAFVGNGWTGNVSAQVFEFLALMGGAADLGMEAKALLVDTATAPLNRGIAPRLQHEAQSAQ